MSLGASLLERIGKLWRDSALDTTWKRPATGWLLWLGFTIPCIWWARHTPTVGYAIAVLAVAAAVMSVLHEPGTIARICWILLLFGFLRVEMNAIDVDKKKSTAELTEHFNEISAEAQRNLSDTIAQFRRQELQVGAFQDQVKTFELRSDIARKNGDKRMAALYKDEANLKRVEMRRALVEAAPETIAELKLQYENWNSQDTTARHSSPMGKSDPEYIKRREQLAEQYTSDLKPTLIDANTFREQLFSALPEKLQRRYSVNQRMALILQGVSNGQVIQLDDLRMVIAFLGRLVQVVSSLPPVDDE